MTQQISKPDSSQDTAPFFWRHRTALLRLAALALIAVVILQNVEPTSIDLLFWSLPAVPKLVLILVAMALGAGLWEVLRRLLLPGRRGRARP